MWALERTKHFTQHNPKLVLYTNHKPLIGIIKNQDVSHTINPRITRLKERILTWRFVDITHRRGRNNCGPDALSRNATMVARHKEALVNKTTIKYKPLRSDEVQKAMAADPEMKLLMKTISNSFPK